MYTRIENCRICGNQNLVDIIDLGRQCLTGAFPRSKKQCLTEGPLELVKCAGGDEVCGLVQLRHSYEPRELYGDNYGYRSALNRCMVAHLQNKVRKILGSYALRPGDLVVDIGSNDSTLLSAYPPDKYTLVGVDPVGAKFQASYPPHVQLMPEFFSLELMRRRFGSRNAKVVTSIAMFYDVEQPLAFVKQVRELLDDRGVWMFEQSYLPGMLAAGSYDTICHEHLGYYGLKQVKWMTDRAGLRIIDVEMNDINGGSFCVTAARTESPYPTAPELGRLLEVERALQLERFAPYQTFASRVRQSRSELRGFLARARQEGKTVHGVGASTKGNVILQYCDIDEATLPFIGEVNRDKVNSYTPGTLIPIIWEDELLSMKSDYLLVLPWHFKSFFESNPKFSGRNLVFALPKLEIVHVA